jgi:hypothetical protein
MLSASIAAAAILSGAAARQPAPDLSLMFLPAVQFEAPGRVTAGLSVFIPTSDDPGSGRDGWIVEARAGQSAGRLAFGRAGYLEYLGLDARAFVSRTWGDPLNASPDATYLGAEAGLSIAYVRVAVGAARRVAGPEGRHATVFTWSAGIQVPFFN